MATPANDSDSKIREFHKSKKVWFFLIVSALVLYFGFLSPSSCGSSEQKSSSATDSSSGPRYFDGQRTITVELSPDNWSDEIVTPAESRDYRIVVEPRLGFFIKFQDGHTEEIRADQKTVKDFGVRRGIFRLKGKLNGQKAVITTNPAR